MYQGCRGIDFKFWNLEFGIFGRDLKIGIWKLEFGMTKTLELLEFLEWNLQNLESNILYQIQEHLQCYNKKNSTIADLNQYLKS
jgi:hypothetical protein